MIRAEEAGMRRERSQAGFAEALVVGGGNRRLERVDGVVDWEPVDRLLEPIYAATVGRPAYPPLTMVKIVLLQSWYGLGDPAMEEALGDRLSFRRFAGLGLGEAVPDHSTICRFRAELGRRGLAEAVFNEINRQLMARGLIIKQGTLIDATLVEAAAAEPRKQKGGGRSTADPDAAWTKRPGGEARFGYKLHVAVDLQSSMVRAAKVTPANINEVVVGHDLVQGDEAAVWADKGYVGPALRERLKLGGIKNRVQRKASRVRRLTPWEVTRNKLIGRVRGRIEGVFGALKRSYGLARMRYMGLTRNTAATFITMTAWNLARAADQAG